MTVPGLCVVMMVRDEANRVGRALDSVRGVAERWLVIDTGSADGTCAEVRAATMGWLGRLMHRRWVDFGTNRTELLTYGAASGARWLLMLDADHELTDTDGLACALANTTADVLQLPYTSTPLQWVTRLIRCGLPARYVGATHEHFDCAAPFRAERWDHPRIINHADGASRSFKWERDRRLLLAQLRADPQDGRAWFYLGETYRGMQQLRDAITAYQQCGQFSADSEQAYVALLYAGCLLASLGHAGEAIQDLQLANAIRPARREALLELCQVLNDQGEHDQVIELLGDSAASRPIPTTDTEGIYPPAYGIELERQLARAKTAHRSRANRSATRAGVSR